MELGSKEDYVTGNREVPLSGVDAKMINFVQAKGMACADEVRAFMNYRGNNAACARLNRLHKAGLLTGSSWVTRFTNRYDAWKATNTLIVSPP